MSEERPGYAADWERSTADWHREEHERGRAKPPLYMVFDVESVGLHGHDEGPSGNIHDKQIAPILVAVASELSDRNDTVRQINARIRSLLQRLEL